MAEKFETKEEEMREEEFEVGEDGIKYRGWKAMPYVIGNETFEKLGTIGTSSNLLVYLTTIFHMKRVAAATLLNIFNGTTNLAPVFGAFLCDTYFGRYFTLGCASIASLMGMLIMTLTAAIPSFHPSQCDKSKLCAGPTPGQVAILLASFAFLITGAGGIRPCNLAFGADQFNPNTDSGRKGINSFFNWYYFTFTFAMMISSTVIIYIQSDISWTLGLAIPTVVMFFSCAVFFAGTRIYVKVKPEGSPFRRIVQVFYAAFEKRRLEHPDDPQQSLFNAFVQKSINSKLPYTDQFRFLDKAAIKTSTDEIKSDSFPMDPWRLCTLQQVEEVKCLLRIIPIWSAGIVFHLALSVNSSYIVFQALQSDRRLGKSKFKIPAGSFSIFTMIALTIWIPIYDRIIVPRLQKITNKEGGITLLQRIGTGMIISIIAMIVAALVEVRRRSQAVVGGSAMISSMSSFWLVPQLTLLGLSEAFNSIGQVEFYYKQFPENMRSVAGSLTFLTGAVASYLTGFMVSLIHTTTGRNGSRNWLDEDLNKGRLDYFYLLTALIGVFNFMYFITFANWYRYKGKANESEINLVENKSTASPV